MENTKNQINAPQFGALQDAITKANEAIIDTLLTAARLRETEPLGAALLGLSDESLELFASIRKYDLMQANKIGFPLFQLRITEPDVLRTILDKGLTEPIVLRYLTKTLPLAVLEKSKKS